MATAFDLIKKQNGEAFAKAVRSYDNGIFDVPNIVDIVKYAGREAEPIMEYLVSLKNVRIEESGETRTPIELLSDAGYDAYYADTLEKQNAIAPYFKYGEKLCTFADENRYQKYHIINAVRKDVDEISREDFPFPEREDRYGTSVISIQILKNGGFISIKNRYNHAVENPDNTFFSDPDRIIKGLSESLKRHFNVDFSSSLANLPEGYTCQNNRVFKYHSESFNTYVGSDFFVKDGKVTQINKDYQIMCDDMILDLKRGQFFSPVTHKEVLPVLNKEIKEKKLSVKISKDKKTKSIYMDKELFMKVKSDGSQILLLNLPTTTVLPSYAFETNHIKSLIIPNLKEVGHNSFLGGVENILVPKGVVVTGNLKLSNKGLTKLPNLSDFIIQGDFSCEGNALRSLEGTPRQIDGDFNCAYNRLTSLEYSPEKLGGAYDCSYNQLTSLIGVPSEIKDTFNCSHNFLENLAHAPQKVGRNFKCNNNHLVTLEGGPTEVVSSYDCSFNHLTTLDFAPSQIGDNLWCQDNMLCSFGKSLKIVGGNLWCTNNKLKDFDSSLKIIGGNFFGTNNPWVSLEKSPRIGGIFNYGKVAKKTSQQSFLAKKASEKQRE